ncbi:hypothetical protein H5410_044197, partial [Solanum commersonii]
MEGAILKRFAAVADSWTPRGSNICFKRNLNDWKADRVVDRLKEVDKLRGTSQPQIQSSRNITMMGERLRLCSVVDCYDPNCKVCSDLKLEVWNLMQGLYSK